MKMAIFKMTIKHASPKLFAAAFLMTDLFCLVLVCGSGWWWFVLVVGGWWLVEVGTGGW